MTNLTDEEQFWEDSGRLPGANPILQAFVDHMIAVQDGERDEEDDLSTDEDVIERWIWYLAEGEQEVSWHPPILEQANAYFERVAGNLGIEYRPGLTHALN